MRVPHCLLVLCFLLFACNTDETQGKPKDSNETEYRTFAGRNYRSSFNDLQDLHIEAAKTNGVGPLATRGDTTIFTDQLVRIPLTMEVYQVDELTHSIPYLVPEASMLLTDIAINFRDSLLSKDMPLYKLRVTSITRTDDDVKRLTKRNTNASDDSSHRYGTTFDIAWVRYDKVDDEDERVRNDGQLKLVLGQVLFDLKERERCYIKHEVKQSCFHITVR